MPKYYFHLVEHRGTLIDAEGANLPDEDAAVASAIHQLRSIVAHDVLETGDLRAELAIRVAAADGQLCRLVPVAEAVSIQ